MIDSLHRDRNLKAVTDETPGAPSLLVAVARLAIWRVRCIARRGAHVPAWGSGTTIYCPPEWRGSAKLSFVMRGAIEPDLAIAVAIVEPGALVVDVGAHYRAFCLPLAHAVGPQGTVIACEPTPAARSVLSRGLAGNGLTNVSVLPFAVSDTTGSALLHVADDPSRSSLSTPADPVQTTEVEPRTLDDVLAGRAQAVRFLKIDVEGHEAQVLRGAEDLLANDRPIIMFEDLQSLRDRPDAANPSEFLRGRGYQLREFWRGTWRIVTGAEHRSKNLWAFPCPDSGPVGSHSRPNAPEGD